MHKALAAVAAGIIAIRADGLAQQSPARELSTDEQIAHVLSRLAFGARPGDAERMKQMGVDRWIAEQLTPERIADKGVEAALWPIVSWSRGPMSIDAQMAMAGPTQAPITSIVENPRGGTMSVTVNYVPPVDEHFYAGKIIRAEMSERQLAEVMADFWENHFSVYRDKMPQFDALMVLSRDAIRPRALGKFRDLLGAVTHTPAMQYYLDNSSSTVAGLNENYARELLELHTLGVDGGFTERDVGEVARALTGWGYAPVFARNGYPARLFAFTSADHDTAEKTILGRRLPSGRGIPDGEEVLDMLAAHPSTARFIATKLARHFVSDSPPPSLVDRAAARFTATQGDIAEVVRAIVTSPEFFSRAAFRAKVKTPFEFVVSARRAYGMPVDTSTATVAAIEGMGQPMWGRRSPDGWPDRAEYWMNSGAMLNRLSFAAEFAAEFAQLAMARPDVRALGTTEMDVALLVGSPAFQRR